MAFQSCLLGGVRVVEVTVGAVAAAVLIRGDVKPSHLGLLHADRGGSVRGGGRRGLPFVLGGALALEARLGALPPGWPTSRQRLPAGCPGHSKIVRRDRNSTDRSSYKMVIITIIKNPRNPTGRRGCFFFCFFFFN